MVLMVSLLMFFTGLFPRLVPLGLNLIHLAGAQAASLRSKAWYENLRNVPPERWQGEWWHRPGLLAADRCVSV